MYGKKLIECKIKTKEQYRQVRERLKELKKKVFNNKEIEIKHPDIEGIRKIKILSVHYVVRPKGNPNIFGMQEMERIRVCEANIKENTIAEDTPLAQAILHKFEGEEYFYNIGNNNW